MKLHSYNGSINILAAEQILKIFFNKSKNIDYVRKFLAFNRNKKNVYKTLSKMNYIISAIIYNPLHPILPSLQGIQPGVFRDLIEESENR